MEATGSQPEDKNSEITERALAAGKSLLQLSLELQAWSGHLDWSKRLVGEGVLRSPQLIEAFSAVSRADFLPDYQKPDEGYDRALEIDHGQSNSQPSLVAEMLEALEPKRGQIVLDVGAGSGWTTALLAAAVGETGQVVGTERIGELVEFGASNISPYGFSWARIEHTEDELGFAESAPYDRILVSAHITVEWVPTLTDQLSPDQGMMIAPVASAENYGTYDFNQDLVLFIREGDKVSNTRLARGVGFVPLVHDQPEA